MHYLHTMLRVGDLDTALNFYVQALGLSEIKRIENQAGRFTLVFLATEQDIARSGADTAPMIELTYNWDPETYMGGRNFGHIAFGVNDIYATCERLVQAGVTINRPPRDGRMAFIRSPEGISIELLQDGPAKAPQEPWASMLNSGSW